MENYFLESLGAGFAEALSAASIFFMYLAGSFSKSFLQSGQHSFTSRPLYSKTYDLPISPSLSPDTGQVVILSGMGAGFLSSFLSAAVAVKVASANSAAPVMMDLWNRFINFIVFCRLAPGQLTAGERISLSIAQSSCKNHVKRERKTA